MRGTCLKLLIFFFTILLFLTIDINSKIRLFTFHYNRPDFLELQIKCFDKFLKEKEDYELIVFNDAIELNIEKQIKQICEKYKIRCINFPQDLHKTYCPNLLKFGTSQWGAVRYCQLVQYALDNFGYDHDDIIGLIEGDVFLIRPFSIREYIKNNDILGVIRTNRGQNKNIEYTWIGLTFFNIEKLPNKKTFNFDFVFHKNTKKFLLDCGGQTYYYLRDNPSVRWKKFSTIRIVDLPREDNKKLREMAFSLNETEFLNKMVPYKAEYEFCSMELHIDNHFIHYSWSRVPQKDSSSKIVIAFDMKFDEFKDKNFKEFINKIIQ